MQRNQVTEKLWDIGTQQFYFTPHRFRDTMLVKKILYTRDFNTNIYYYYLIDTYDGIKRFLITHPLHKPGLRFTCYLHMETTIEL